MILGRRGGCLYSNNDMISNDPVGGSVSGRKDHREKVAMLWACEDDRKVTNGKNYMLDAEKIWRKTEDKMYVRQGCGQVPVLVLVLKYNFVST